MYTPAFIGKKDILIVYDRIGLIDDAIDTEIFPELEVVNAEGKLVLPGFVDQHVHITGGGGEGGFATRISPLHISDLVQCGVTTVVGILGTDGITRSLEDLYAKAKGLEEEGISTYIYSGSYQFPIKTLTGSIERDMVLIDKVIGVGEIAISDHRSFEITENELSRIGAAVRNGGMISGKSGVVHLHIGDGQKGLEVVFNVVKNTQIPIRHFVPTHVNRNRRVLEQALEFARMGGFIDITAGFEKDELCPDCIPAHEALEYALSYGVDENLVSMSSDGNGSIPVFDGSRKLKNIKAGECSVLLKDIRKAVIDLNIPLEKALKSVTCNPARILNIDKGCIEEGKYADIIVADSKLNIDKVYARGQRLVNNGNIMS